MSLSKPDLTDVKVPVWVKFIAQDADGSWWGYSVEPLQNHRGWYENELGDNVKLIDSDSMAGSNNWQTSLFKYMSSS